MTLVGIYDGFDHYTGKFETSQPSNGSKNMSHFTLLVFTVRGWQTQPLRRRNGD